MPVPLEIIKAHPAYPAFAKRFPGPMREGGKAFRDAWHVWEASWTAAKAADPDLQRYATLAALCCQNGLWYTSAADWLMVFNVGVVLDAGALPPEDPGALLGRLAAERMDSAVLRVLEADLGTPPDIAQSIDQGPPPAVPGPWQAFQQTGAPVVATRAIEFPAPCGPVASGTRGRILRVLAFNQEGRPTSFRAKFEGHDGTRVVTAGQVRILDWPGEVPPAVPLTLVRAIVTRVLDDAADVEWEITDDDLKGGLDILAEWVRHGKIIDNRDPDRPASKPVPDFICDVCEGRECVITAEPGRAPTLDCEGCPNHYVLDDSGETCKWEIRAAWPPGIERPDPATFNMVAANHFLDGSTRRCIVPAGMKGVALEMVQDGDKPAAMVWWANGEKVTATPEEAYILKRPTAADSAEELRRAADERGVE